jgi:hypothetical protein
MSDHYYPIIAHVLGGMTIGVANPPAGRIPGVPSGRWTVQVMSFRLMSKASDGAVGKSALYELTGDLGE